MHEIHKSGRCRDSDHELFFSQRATDLMAAQEVCRQCPVRIACLELALVERHEYGVWGGVIFWDGQAFHRKRGRGRPSRAEAHLPVEADLNELEELVASA